MSFLTAEWRRLAFANYEIDPNILEPYVPNKTELDFFEGKCYVSLVGFMFNNVRVLGLKIPYHVNFEEVNLRFYVRYNDKGEWKRGVVFIKEIVPRGAIAMVANTFYNEQYEKQKMNHVWEERENELLTSYRWQQKGKWQEFAITSSNEKRNIVENSIDEFITEHYWGYSRQSRFKTNEYEVTHLKWQVYNVTDYKINTDFTANYGTEFEFLNNAKPTTVMLAEGSEITIEGKRKL